MSLQIICIGWSHKNAPIQFRDKAALAQDEILSFYADVSSQDTIEELAVISTCNRTEFYAFAGGGASVLQWIESFYRDSGSHDLYLKEVEPYTLAGSQAIEQLCRVSAGMDSMMLGENQILSQVKTAHEQLLLSGVKSPVLHQLFRDAVSCGKEIRTATHLCKGAVSISFAAVELAKRVYSNFIRQKILVVGAGESAELTIKHFKDCGAIHFMVANRSQQNGKKLADKYQASYHSLEEIPQLLKEADIIIAATHSKEYLLNLNEVHISMDARNHKNMLMIDISTPRNIDPEIHNIQEVFLFDIDHLEDVIAENLEKRKQELSSAKEIVQKHSLKFMGWLKSLQVKPTISLLNQYYEKIRNEEIERYRHKITSSEMETLSQLSKGLVRKLLHYPINHLKDLADGQELDPQTIDTIWRLYRLEEMNANQDERDVG